MKNSELRGYVTPPEKPPGPGDLATLGLAAFAVTGVAMLVFFRPDAVSGAWAAISGNTGRTPVTSAAPPPVKAQAAPPLPFSGGGDPKQIAGTMSMLSAVNRASASALGVQDVMMGNVKDPAKAEAIMAAHAKNLKAMQKDASKVLGIPDFDSLDLAEETPVGAQMMETCRRQAAAKSASVFKEPAAIARFANCYMTTNLDRLCDPVQKKALVEILGWHGAAQKFWKKHEEKKAGVTVTDPPKPGDWDNPASRALPVTLAKLGAQGYVAADDLRWRAPADVKAALEGVKAERTPCAAVAQK